MCIIHEGKGMKYIADNSIQQMTINKYGVITDESINAKQHMINFRGPVGGIIENDIRQ